MAGEKPPPDPWNITWETAFTRFDKLVPDRPQLAAVSDVIAQLKVMPEVRGLFIKSSMFTAFITPYSCYPDFFDGRRITIDAGPNADSPVAVCYLRDGFDKSPANYSYPVPTAAQNIAALCREHL
jgi:hypothetical protein